MGGIKNPNLVVAIDIGSRYSGYAWQWRSNFLRNRSHVEFNTNWGSGADQVHKTSTCILLKAKKGCQDEYEIEAFGQIAEDIYKDMYKENECEIYGKLFLFKRFKHLLHSKGFHREIQVEDQIGQCASFLDVMSKLLQALKDHFIDNLKQKGQRVNLENTQWVITVPAIWSNEAKQFMRYAAEMGGIAGDKLLLALEPEAAAIYCIHLPDEQRENMNNLGQPGQLFLTADIGGLTADLSAVKVNEDGSLTESCIAEVEFAGGQNVIDAFFQIWHDRFEGDAWMKTFQKVTAAEWMNMEDSFEQQMVKICTSDKRLDRIELKLPYVVGRELEKKTIRLKETPDIESRFQLKNDKMTFSSAFIRNKLSKVIKGALEDEQLRECKNIVLVGGFAESPIVVEHIKEMIKESFPTIHVVVPTSPFQAVLAGAVLFGHDHVIFRSRISRFTYGIGISAVFNEKIHDVKKKFFNAEKKKYYCKDVFSVHIEKGQPVKLEEEQKSHIYHLAYKGQKRVKILVYASKKVPLEAGETENHESVMYTTDEDCQKIGEVEVPFSTTSKTDRNLRVWMTYGGTELSVFATDEKSGEMYDARITFSNE